MIELFVRDVWHYVACCCFRLSSYKKINFTSGVNFHSCDTFTVGGEPPYEAIMWALLVVIILLMIGLLVAFLLTRRRRRLKSDMAYG